MARQLLDLPFDVVLRLWLFMTKSTQVAFVRTCKALYQTHALAILYKRFQQHAAKGPVLLALAPQRTLVRRVVKYVDFPNREEDDGRCTNDLCDDDSEAVMVVGSSKYKESVHEDWVVDPPPAKPHTLEWPFVVTRAAYTSDRSDILLHVVFPDHTTRNDSVEVVAMMHEIGFSSDFEDAFRRGYYKFPFSDERGRLEEHGPFSYKATMASTGYTFQRLNNARVWRTWYMRECGECGGQRSICPGCGGVSGRWPEAFASCGYGLPCPLCVGYDAACEGVDYVRRDDQRSLDELFNVACINTKTWTKDEWETQITRKEQSKQSNQHVAEGARWST
ncbi:hypothetical protein EXIGLDRAFT_724361 [Exidia glandulosa HHB12029]|uniref:Uncharacterized protein n=1 Tax=Exidia glandulosa HHB12029 TaxID=1314781 RepID=A0A165EG16_EXIGL|nr:hypothetical protein EXIGLDRAFT_724361 [Exidia glandulosa HHB12029]